MADQANTRDMVREMRARDPEVTAAELARALGVSRERVRQHLAALGLPTRTYRSITSCGRPGMKQPVARVRTGGVPTPITHSAAGTVAELLVAADLSARGFTVYAPICRHTAHADLIGLRRGEECSPLLFEVRSGRRLSAGHVSYNKPEKSKAHHHAIVITGEPVIYKPLLPDATAKPSP